MAIEAMPWSTIKAYLLTCGHELELHGSPERCAGGLANLNYRVTLDGIPAIFRRPPGGDLPRGAHDMRREAFVLQRLAPAWGLAPRSLHLCADESIIGVPFHILEFREGLVVRGDRLDPLPSTATTAAKLTDAMLSTLVSLHSVDCRAADLGDWGRPHGHLTRTVSGWIARSEHVPTTSRAIQTIAPWLLARVVDRDVPPSLLHNDFKLDNLLLSDGGDRVEAVLDWDMASRGDPLLDLATLLSYWTQPQDPPCMHRLAQMPTARPGFPTREEFAAAYARASGRDVSDIHTIWILALFKLGIVFHQLADRRPIGEPKIGEFREIADGILEFAAEATLHRTM